MQRIPHSTAASAEVGLDQDCEICGTVNANTNAAGNILARRNDKKIMQYTPYRRVKEICEERAAALNAAVDTSNSNIW